MVNIRFRYSVRALLICILMVALGMATLKALSSVFISQGTALRVQEGMTRKEVADLAGNPHEVGENGSWLYNVWGFSDMLHITFSEDNKVELITF